MFSKHDAKGLNVTEIPGEHSLGKDDEKSTVPAKYRGTDADKDDMVVLGRVQVLRRNFNFPTMLGFASTVLVAWEILPVISVYALEDGGTAIIFWGLIAGIIGMTFVYASLAEMASMFPTAGGQYRMLADPNREPRNVLIRSKIGFPNLLRRKCRRGSATWWVG
ncbi:hypothetical protein LTR27_007821 [Elasticomyces elasticus]|nr:hypothetical protein LTR27_007821 [Elasticomyces elasticus]